MHISSPQFTFSYKKGIARTDGWVDVLFLGLRFSQCTPDEGGGKVGLLT